MFKLRMKGVVARFFSKLVRFREKQLGWIRFFQEEEPYYLDDPISNRRSPESPSPRCVLGNETACYWPNCRSKQWSKTVYADRTASFFGSPTIAKDAPTKLLRISDLLDQPHISAVCDLLLMAQSHQTQTIDGTQSSLLYSYSRRKQY